MNPLRLPSDLVSPQYTALTGTLPDLQYERYIEAQAQQLPALQAEEYSRSVLEEQLRLQQEQNAAERRDANLALAIKGAELTAPLVKKYGSKILEAARPKPIPLQGDIGPLPGAVAPTRLASASGGVSDVGGNWFDNLAAKAAEPAKAGFQTASGESGIAPVLKEGGMQPLQAVAAAPTQSFSGMLPKLGVSPTLTSMGAGLAGSAAGALVERSNFGEFMHKRGVMGEKEADVLGGAASGFLTGFALGGIPGGIAGGIGGLLKGLF